MIDGRAISLRIIASVSFRPRLPDGDVLAPRKAHGETVPSLAVDTRGCPTLDG